MVYLELGAGIVLVGGLHAAVAVAMGTAAFLGGDAVLDVMAQIGIVWALFLGLTQWLYVAPAVVVAWVVRRPLAMGMLIGGGLTFLLNTACYGSFAAVGFIG